MKIIEISTAICRGCHPTCSHWWLYCDPQTKTQIFLWTSRDISISRLYRICTIWNLTYGKGSYIHTKTWWDYNIYHAVLLSRFAIYVPSRAAI